MLVVLVVVLVRRRPRHRGLRRAVTPPHDGVTLPAAVLEPGPRGRRHRSARPRRPSSRSASRSTTTDLEPRADSTAAWQAALDHYDVARRVRDRRTSLLDVVGAVVLAERGAAHALGVGGRGRAVDAHQSRATSTRCTARPTTRRGRARRPQRRRPGLPGLPPGPRRRPRARHAGRRRRRRAGALLRRRRSSPGRRPGTAPSTPTSSSGCTESSADGPGRTLGVVTDPVPPLRLREPSERVSPRARLMWALPRRSRGGRSSSWRVVGPVTDWLPVPGWVAVLVGVAALAYAVVVPQWRYLVHRWEVTETAVYTQTGWWARERRIAPMSRIQTVDHAEGAIARLFGLATVTVTTASAAGALRDRRPRPRPSRARLVDELDRQADAVGATPRERPAPTRPPARVPARAATWQRLDPRMLLVHPIRELVRFLPALIGARSSPARASGGDGGGSCSASRSRSRSACCATSRPASGSPTAGSSCGAGCSTGTSSRRRSTGSAPSTSPPRPSTGCSA